MQPSHVLVPLDGSPLAEKALEYALAVFDCQISVLNVITPLDSPLSEGGVRETGDERRETARERVEQLVAQTKEAEAGERTIETTVETGDPATTILEYVDSHGIDQIVMGGHGGDAGRITRRLLGTVVTAVVGEASVTVTVVR